jgi:hypothetical protein
MTLPRQRSRASSQVNVQAPSVKPTEVSIVNRLGLDV